MKSGSLHSSIWNMVILIGCILCVGCTTASNPANQTNSNHLLNLTSNATGLTNTTPNSTTGKPAGLIDAFLCGLQNSNQREYFILFNDQYIYELHNNLDQLQVEMAYLNRTLYVHFLNDHIPGCTWAAANAEDLRTIKSLGGIKFLSVEQVYAAVPASSCKPIQIYKPDLKPPQNACPLRTYILKGLGKRTR